MTKDDLYSGLSLPRNKELMRIYRDLDMVEQLGSGVPRILKSYPKESFTFGDSFMRMTFMASEPVFEVVKTELAERLVDGLADGLVDGLVESQKKILQLILDNPYTSKKDMSERIGISTTAIDKNITKLKQKKIIERIGSDRGGYWKIIENIK